MVMADENVPQLGRKICGCFVYGLVRRLHADIRQDPPQPFKINIWPNVGQHQRLYGAGADLLHQHAQNAAA